MVQHATSAHCFKGGFHDVAELEWYAGQANLGARQTARVDEIIDQTGEMIDLPANHRPGPAPLDWAIFPEDQVFRRR